MWKKKTWWEKLSEAAKQRSRYAARRFESLLLDRRQSNLRWMHDQLRLVETELIVLARGSRERLEIRRRAAEQFLNTCLMENAPWTMSRRVLLELESLGYTNIDRRVHFAIMLGRYRPPDCPPSLVINRLQEAVRRTNSLPRRSPFRRANVPLMQELIEIYQSNSDPQPKDLKNLKSLGNLEAKRGWANAMGSAFDSEGDDDISGAISRLKAYLATDPAAEHRRATEAYIARLKKTYRKKSAT